MSKNIDSLIRPNIAALCPYSTARDEYQGNLGIFLDANESPFENGWNRYPDPHQKNLKSIVSAIKGIPVENIFLGNGSDEAIDLIFRIFCIPGKDNALAISPSYGMYEVSAATNDIALKKVPLLEDFSLDTERLMKQVNESSKVIFLCCPNNPSGNAFPREQILDIARRFDGIVVVDEAYIDYSSIPSIVPEATSDAYGNIVVLQTMSKARGMAALRLGMAFSSERIISLMSMVKYPYNISKATQEIAAGLLKRDISEQIQQTIAERERIAKALEGLDCVRKVWPSEANFLLVEVDDADKRYEQLIAKGVIVRNRTRVPGCHNCLRISIGTKEENDLMLSVLSSGKVPFALGGRCSEICRKTRETDIRIRVNLDRNPQSPGGFGRVDTGLKFFDHMLDQIVHHGGISLDIKCFGDLEVDEHHTIEDVGIALGEAITKALGDKRGIGRYGFALPMDESRAMVLLDFGGRPELVWDVEFTREYVGDVPTEMFEHFFKSLCTSMKANLYVQARGENNHHIAESIFKAFARSIRQADAMNAFEGELPSSKGLL